MLWSCVLHSLHFLHSSLLFDRTTQVLLVLGLGSFVVGEIFRKVFQALLGEAPWFSFDFCLLGEFEGVLPLFAGGRGWGG